MKLFLDIDGVLADFDRGVQRLLGKRPDQLAPKRMWSALARAPAFFATLQMMADARDLWDFCRSLNPTILTGLPRGSWAEDQKRRWVADMLGRDVPVITTLSHLKHRHAAPGHILVDNRVRLRRAWEAAGGTFIHHVSAERSIVQLGAVLFDLRDAGPPGAAPAGRHDA